MRTFLQPEAERARECLVPVRSRRGRRMLRNPAYVVADRTLAAKGRSFHWARRLLDEVHADRATRLYGLCRRIDDLADEAQSPDAARDDLAALDRAFAAGSSHDPLTSDALRLIEECRIDPAIPRTLIAGVAGDLGRVRVRDQDELLRYCYRVAGTVGLMMAAALDANDPAAAPHAIDLGVAMQLTNLCRDVQADAEAGRRYVPSTLVGEAEPPNLACPSARDHARGCDAVLALLDLADGYYASGEAGLRFLPQRAAAGILVAAHVYRAIGTRLRRRGGDAWAGRVVVPAHAKAAITAGCLASAAVRGAHGASAHDPRLHAALAGLPGVPASAAVRHG